MKECLACCNCFESDGWQCPQCSFVPQRKNGFFLLAPKVHEGHTELEVDSFEFLAGVESKSFWFQARNKLIIWALRKYFPNAKSFLEIGCGTGFVLSGVAKQVSNLSISGSELSVDGLGYAAGRVPEAELFQMDALRIPFNSEFDVIGAFDVIEHIESDNAVLEQMFNAVKPGGGVIITVPQHMSLWSYFDEMSKHFRRYSKPELHSKLEAAGFKVIMSTGFISFLLPAIMVLRTCFEHKSKEQVSQELQPAGLVGVALRLVLGLEYILIKCGLRFPFGNSLLMIGQRIQSPS